MLRRGFTFANTGGNCTAWIDDDFEGAELWLTDREDPSAPLRYTDSALVSLLILDPEHPDNYEPEATFTREFATMDEFLRWLRTDGARALNEARPVTEQHALAAGLTALD